MSRLERAGVQGEFGPKLNPEHDLAYWNEQAKKNGTIAPQLKIAVQEFADESDADEAVPERFAATSMADAPSPLSRDDVPDGLVEQARAVLAPGSSDKRPRH